MNNYDGTTMMKNYYEALISKTKMENYHGKLQWKTKMKKR